MKNFRPRLLATELFLFLSVQFIGFFTAIRIIELFEIPPKLETAPSLLWFAGAFLIATAFIIFLIKFTKKPTFFKGLFAFLIFIGADIIFSAFIPALQFDNGFLLPMSSVLALGIVIYRFKWPNVFSQNLAVILAVAGVGVQLGLTLPVIAVIGLLIVLSVYDYIAVFKTKHMQKMFGSLAQKGLPLAIVIPEKMGDMRSSMKHVHKHKFSKKRAKKQKFLMLGTGDLAFPLLFAVSALDLGVGYALSVIAGSVFGIIGIHYLMTQKKIKALPALPPLAASTITAFAIYWLTQNPIF